jgi:NhaP-type Na+/H+ and K+/H+ antiporter
MTTRAPAPIIIPIIIEITPASIWRNSRILTGPPNLTPINSQVQEGKGLQSMGKNVIPVRPEGVIPVPGEIPDHFQESRPDLIIRDTRKITPDRITEIRESDRIVARDQEK